MTDDNEQAPETAPEVSAIPEPSGQRVDSDVSAEAGTSAVPLAIRLIEAMVFASPDPVSERAIAELLEAQALVPPETEDLAAYVRGVIEGMVALYAGRGVAPVLVAGGWQFRTVADLAPRLTRVLHRPRRLSRATLESLAIIAYHQPCTRAEIEEIRGVSLSQQVLDTLLEASLIVPRGRKEVPGRPILWGTSADFLRHFGLRDLRDLPRREELLLDVPDNPALRAAAPEAAKTEAVSGPPAA